jgi:hypothetical protein
MYMELGQILHNNPVAIDTTPFINALIFHIRREITWAYWNVNQKRWAGDPDYDPWTDSERSFQPLPLGIEWRPYYNWGGAPDDADWDQDEANKPNFSFEGVEVRWYKNFGRSMNVNVDWSAEAWRLWFERVIQTIQAYNSRAECFSGMHPPLPYPDPASKVPLL